MVQVYLVVAVVCLVVSWVYILLLKVKIRDCMGYIQNRIDQANLGVQSIDAGPHQEGETRRAAPPPRNCLNAMTLFPSERGAMEQKPHLIVGDADGHRPFHYQCSHCFHPFSLAGNQPAKGTVEELFRRFREHVEEEHPDIAPRSNLGAKGY